MPGNVMSGRSSESAYCKERSLGSTRGGGGLRAALRPTALRGGKAPLENTALSKSTVSRTSSLRSCVASLCTESVASGANTSPVFVRTVSPSWSLSSSARFGSQQGKTVRAETCRRAPTTQIAARRSNALLESERGAMMSLAVNS